MPPSLPSTSTRVPAPEPSVRPSAELPVAGLAEVGVTLVLAALTAGWAAGGAGAGVSAGAGVTGIEGHSHEGYGGGGSERGSEDEPVR